MLKRLVFPFVVAVCASLSAAQGVFDKDKNKNKDKDKSPVKQPEKPVKVTLDVGDKAPAIRVDSWVKGTPVRSFEKGQVYVVEFWATWCEPCERSIPHLTEIQQKYKGLTVIGVAALEEQKSSGSDRRLKELERWVKGKGKVMDYAVAYDGDRQMFRSWMAAAGRTSVPSAFIVDGEGKVAWIGGPSEAAFDTEVEKAVKAAADAKDATKKGEKNKKDEKTSKPAMTDTPTKKPADAPPKKDDDKK